ncbi:MAG TPA: bacteriohemerythrin [Terracidiphilus sp.]|nr:bacteriohemerythrin [Terracidiphilus sp.]
MSLIHWEDSYSTGVKAMDDQHKRLVAALNDLHGAMLEGKEKAVTGSLLGMLVKYTHEHFLAEEGLMARANYPKLAEHKSQHRNLTDQVQKFAERYQRGELAINVDLLMFLRNWLLNHIQKTDREYGPWLTRHGAK